MHPTRRAIVLRHTQSEALRGDHLQSAKEFLVGWAAGLIFFWTMLS
ncbi:MAG TPA: hypothetical protein VF631_03110 [Allosphingosinicella sp.]|jgi:hypothetical protein